MATETDKTSLSFGRYLQAIRIEKGISLEAVSKETRIRMETLVQIEDEDHDKLPQQVYVMGFLRAYAKSIQADGDEAVERYLSRLNVARKIAASEADLDRSKKNFWPRLILSLVTLLALIMVTLFVVSYIRDRSVSIQQPTPVADQPSVEQPVAEPAQDNATLPEADLQTNAPPAVKYILRIQTTEETSMKVTADSQEPMEYNLTPGDKIELEASTGYTLTIGNAGGVDLFLNGEPVEVAGASGQVVNLQLP